MRNIFRVILVFLIQQGSPFFLHAKNFSDSLLYQNIGNGLNMMLYQIPGASDAELIINVKAGTVFETDSNSGVAYMVQNILSDKLAAYLRNNMHKLNFGSARLQAFTTSELACFKITTTPENIAECFTLFADSLFYFKITSAEVDSVLAQLKRENELNESDAEKKFERKISEGVFRNDFYKQYIYGNPWAYRFINFHSVKKFFEKYYVPNNTIGSVAGKFNLAETQRSATAAFLHIPKSEFNPEMITKIVGFKPMLYNTQFILNTDGKPEFEIAWQFPGTAGTQRTSYPAFLLGAVLNDKNNFIKVKLAKMGCKKFQAVYDPNNFSGALKVYFQPDVSRIAESYFFVVKELNRLDETLLNESMINAAKLQFQKEFTQLKESKEYPYWIAKYWTYKSEVYFPTLLDSVFSVTEKRMKRFAEDYINASPRIAGLKISEEDRRSTNIDSLFTNLNDSIKFYVFKYRPNITELEGEQNYFQLKNLLQWLKLNTDVYVQVNGFADEGEFNKVYDDSVIQFMDSIPTFQKTNPDLIKKGYLRPEMMRAMRIIKFLYENGIEADRLSGTSMYFSSGNKKEEEDNMKCTLTLDKSKRNISLYEYHYGKPKPKE